MDNDSNPEFSGYLHAIARRKALLFGVAIPIVVLAILLALALPDRYTSSALVEIDEASSATSLAEASSGASYADQYVKNLKGIVLTDTNLRKMAGEHDLYPEYEGNEAAMLVRMKRDIGVKIVTTPILDPRTGREREVVDAFTLSFDHRKPDKAQAGAQWLVGAGRLPSSYVAGQGHAVHRDGRVHVTADGDEVWVGGDVVTVVSGDVRL